MHWDHDKLGQALTYEMTVSGDPYFEKTTAGVEADAAFAVAEKALVDGATKNLAFNFNDRSRTILKII
jgi:hypothetical protein